MNVYNNLTPSSKRTKKEVLKIRKEKLELFNFIQEAATIGTWKFDIIKKHLNWSSVTKRIHELDDNYIPDLSTGIYFYKEGYSRDTITELVKNCIEKFEKYDVELQIITAKGNEKWVRAVGIPIVENGKCVSLHGLFQDIDIKTKALKEVAYKEEQFRKTFDYAVLGMAIVDLEGNWVRTNKSLQKMLGYKNAELQSLSILDISHPEDLKDGIKELKLLLHGKLENYQTEKRLISKTGGIVHSIISTSLVRNNLGQPLNFVVQINNVSDFKKASKKVNELLNTSETQNERLRNFAHIVSHNLRSHYGNLEMLLNLMEVDVPEDTNNEFFPMIKSAISGLGETVENLNEVAILNTQKNVEVIPLNLSQYIDKSIKNIKAIALKCNAVIKVKIDKTIQVYGIAAYLDSIILNFLTNCIKYKHPERQLKISISAKKENEFVILKIKDNGVGIDLNKYGDKLFGMYKTFHKHKDARGIGLFITKNQVEAIGGEIKVKSKVNSGTTFKILFRHEEN